jgi:predicted TIM-barrel fold metal-dependent hydrolase
MRNGHSVIDSDGHVMEPADLWDRYIDGEFRGVRPICATDSTEVEVMGYRLSRSYEDQAYRDASVRAWNERDAALRARGYDAASQLESMDVEGIDRMVLYPTRGLHAVAIADLDGRVSAAICRAYNRWLYDFCQANPERLIGVALLALHDPDLAIAEATYAVGELGMRAVMVRPNPYRGRNLHDPAYDDFYAAISDLDVPLALHEGCGVWMPEYGTDRFTEHIARHAMCHPMEQMGAVLSFTVGGVMERHPDLRVLFLEAGGTWLPYWLSRLDEHVEWLGEIETPNLTMAPSDYFRRNGWIGFEPDEPGLRGLIDYIGVDRLLWASDYPHPDAKFPGAVDELFATEALTDEELRSIVDHNPVASYGLG